MNALFLNATLATHTIWHRNDVLESALQFGPIGTAHIGATAILALGFGTQPLYQRTIWVFVV